MRWQTERLRVEPFRPEDWEALYPILSDPEVMRHIEPPFTPERTRAFLREAGELVYAVWLGENLAGQLIFHPLGADWELGWILSRQFWGRGLATELTAGAVEYARKQNIPGLVIEFEPAQAASRRIAQKCGFAYRGLEEGLEVWRLALAQ